MSGLIFSTGPDTYPDRGRRTYAHYLAVQDKPKIERFVSATAPPDEYFTMTSPMPVSIPGELIYNWMVTTEDTKIITEVEPMTQFCQAEYEIADEMLVRSDAADSLLAEVYKRAMYEALERGYPMPPGLTHVSRSSPYNSVRLKWQWWAVQW